jgi:hypothetical protein
METRLDTFLAGNLSTILQFWRDDRAKLFQKPLKKKGKKKEVNIIKNAVDLVYEGFISRATKLVEGFGRTSCDQPAIQKQMLDKHPQKFPIEWEPLPSALIDGREIIDFEHLKCIIHELDPKVGVGPRGLHADHIRKFLDCRMTDPESSSALVFFQELGILYLNCSLPPWVRAILGTGLLTPLNKTLPNLDGTVDARPVKAEDTDTSVWVKTLARSQTPFVRNRVTPQQLGVGIRGGVQLQAIGLKLKYDEAVRLQLPRVLVVSDIKNAHNSFDRTKCRSNIFAAVSEDPSLSPLLLGLQATLSQPIPIYTRTEKNSSGLSFLCDSCQGGGQGNALTGLAFVLTIDPVLKGIESNFDVEVKAIHDDIVLFGHPDDIFGDNKALQYLIDGLQRVAGCTPQLKKFQVLGSLPDCCNSKPPDLKRPSIIYTDPETLEQKESYGLEICGAPIGEENFVKKWLDSKSEEISSTIQTTSNKLASKDLHVAHTVLHLSLQNRSDYILSTNLPSQTISFTKNIENALSQAYSMILHPNLINHHDETSTTDPNFPEDPLFISDRFLLKICDGGGGYRPLQKTHRASYLNCLNSILPLCLNLTDNITEQIHIPGLWHSLHSILGSESFNPTHIDSRWLFFFSSGSPFGVELREEWFSLQNLRRELLLQLSEEDRESPLCCGGPLTDNAESFGKDHPSKLSEHIFDSIQAIRSKVMITRAHQLPINDPRRLSFLSSRNDKFSNTLLQAMPDKLILFSHSEFQEVISNHFGLPSPTCSSIIGKKIKNNENSKQLQVDSYGFNLKTVQGAKGDHIRTFHDNIVATISQSLTQAAISHRGGPYRTCRDLFSHLLNPRVILSDSNTRHLQGIIPDLVVDASRLISDVVEESMHGKITLIDVKTLAPGIAYSEKQNKKPNEAVEKRASAVNKQYHLHAKNLDHNLHGTLPDSIGIIERELNSYGCRGKVLGACVGAFGECSRDIYALRDLISHCQGLNLMDSTNLSYQESTAIYKRKITRNWGLTFARGWARVLLSRRRDLVDNPANYRRQYTHNPQDYDPVSADLYENFNHRRRHR